MPVLDKFSKSKVYVSKTTGLLFHDDFKSSEKVAGLWSKNFKKNTNVKKGYYTSNNPNMMARHVYCVEFIRKNIKKIKEKSICDFGAGEGNLLKYFNKFYNHKNLYAVEHSKKNCEIIKRKLSINKKNIVNKSIENSKYFFNRKKIDIGIMTWTLCNCSEPINVTKTIYSILKKNGYLLVAESSRILVPFKKPIFNFFGSGKGYMHPWYFSYNSLRNLLITNGFQLVAKNDFRNENDLILLFKKKNKKQKIKIDNPKKVVKFMKEWVNYSKKIS